MIPMPAGTYVSVIGSIRPGAGGQTRVLLMRHRLLGTERGIDVPILTYNPTPSYHDVRASLRRDGLLLPGSRVLNMHEDLRDRDLSGLPATESVARGPADGGDDRRDGEGRVWRRTMTPAGGGPPWWDYLRIDGTTYARTPVESTTGRVEAFGSDGSVLGSWQSLGGMWRWWTQLITPDAGHVFILSDSRHVAGQLSQIDDERFHVLHQIHNPHTVGRRHWTSEISRSYRTSMWSLARLDAVSTLTTRQRDDVARRFGGTDNLVVIPNPVERPTVPDPLPSRTPGRIVMIARLHQQKRLDRALGAFALLAAERPEARLDVYGDGPDRSALEARIRDARLTGRVVLHGHDPRAADQLWSADLAWLTSGFEGFGLFISEALARGCPVLSFDVPYGPREQVTDGRDGLLVPAGDVTALARATAELLDDRARLEAMREPARQAGARHGHEQFLDDWAGVVAGAVERKAHRTRIDGVRLDSVRLGLPRRWAVRRAVSLSAELTVSGAGDLDQAQLSWQAWTRTSPEPFDLPLSSSRTGGAWRIAGVVSPALLRTLSADRLPVHLRLLLVARNSAWQHELFAGRLDRGERTRIIRRLRRLVRRAAPVED